MYFVRTKFQFYTNNESLKTLHKTETTTILVTLVGTVGMFSALPKLVCANWHHRSKKFNTGRERAQHFVTMWFLHLFSQRNQKCDEDCRLGQTVDLHMRRTKLINKKLG